MYGLLGILIAYLIINWDGLNLIGPVMKCQLVCIVIMLFIFILVFSSVSGFERIDYFGHLGGFLTGLWICCIHDTIVQNNRERNLRIIGLVLLIVQFVICFTVFFTIELDY